jgi:hypothetical protein
VWVAKCVALPSASLAAQNASRLIGLLRTLKQRLADEEISIGHGRQLLIVKNGVIFEIVTAVFVTH